MSQTNIELDEEVGSSECAQEQSTQNQVQTKGLAPGTRRRRYLILGTIVALIVVAVGVALGVALSQKQTSQDLATTADTSPSADPPTTTEPPTVDPPITTEPSTTDPPSTPEPTAEQTAEQTYPSTPEPTAEQTAEQTDPSTPEPTAEQTAEQTDPSTPEPTAEQTYEQTAYQTYEQDFFGMSDAELFAYGLAAGYGTVPKIGKYCHIQDATAGGGACNYYAKGRPDAFRVGEDGVPVGTGCVEDRATFGRGCWYEDLDYIPLEDRQSFCTEDYIANGANQMRYAMKNGLCDDFKDPDFEALSDEELFAYGLAAGYGTVPKIGKYCYIQDASTGDETCNYYAKGRPDAFRVGEGGVPVGTGCVEDSATFGRGCWYEDLDYIPLDDRQSFCTEDYIANGANQMRYAMKKGLCDDFKEPDFEALSDEELFAYGLAAGYGTVPKIGKYCYIQDASTGDETCNYYAKGRPDAVEVGSDGIPEGTGCIDDQGVCWYPDHPSFCTGDYIANGANQIRFGMKNWFCEDPPDYMAMSDEELFQHALDAGYGTNPKIGKYCYIEDASAGGGACKYYAKGRPDAFEIGHDGIPVGTGCVGCWYSQVDCISSEDRNSFCAGDYKTKGANQIRFGIKNGLCDDAPDYMAMSNAELFQYALDAGYGTNPKIGMCCFIEDATAGGGACNYYAKGRPDAVEVGYDGIPEGTGCIDDRGICWYPDHPSFCTGDYETNGANQIRFGFENGLCHREPF